MLIWKVDYEYNFLLQINRKGKVLKRLEIPVNENVNGGMTKTELSEAVEKEHQLVQQDLKMERTKDRKNALESYVYDMRDKVHFRYNSYNILPFLNNSYKD